MLWLVNGRPVDGATGRPRRGALAVAAGRVAEIAPGGPPRGARVVDLDGSWVFPGLVNAHDHLHLNAFPPTAPGRPYRHSADWVAHMAELIESPAFRRLRSVPERARAFHGGLKNALSGATTVVHHDPWRPAFDEPEFPVRVVRPMGWAHSPGLAGRYGPGLAEAWAASPPGAPFFVHVAEGTDGRAAAELEQLDAAGCLDVATRLVHGVGLGPAEVRLALDRGAALVWCPASNLRLLDRTADPAPFAAVGRAALGTDSRLTGSRDLLAELGLAAASGPLPPEALLRLVTVDGARLVGRPAAGRLAPGSPADLVVLPATGPSPALDLCRAERSALRLVLCGGRPVVADPDLAEALDGWGWTPLEVELDGRGKWLAAGAWAPLAESALAEPGLAAAALARHRAVAHA
jgi:cytosine/adenosine deaminase-related metal-dependent hydrolase